MTGDKLLMKKRNRIMLLSGMILAAAAVFLIMRGPAGSGRNTGDENAMISSDDEVQIVGVTAPSSAGCLNLILKM